MQPKTKISASTASLPDNHALEQAREALAQQLKKYNIEIKEILRDDMTLGAPHAELAVFVSNASDNLSIHEAEKKATTVVAKFLLGSTCPEDAATKHVYAEWLILSDNGMSNEDARKFIEERQPLLTKFYTELERSIAQNNTKSHGGVGR